LNYKPRFELLEQTDTEKTPSFIIIW